MDYIGRRVFLRTDFRRITLGGVFSGRSDGYGIAHSYGLFCLFLDGWIIFISFVWTEVILEIVGDIWRLSSEVSEWWICNLVSVVFEYFLPLLFLLPSFSYWGGDFGYLIGFLNCYIILYGGYDMIYNNIVNHLLNIKV